MAVDLKPDMTAGEAALYRDVLQGRQGLFEFGCGGSTLLAVRQGVPRIVSVDSDPAWLDRLREHPLLAAQEQAGGLGLIHADIGPVGRWGRPADPTPRPQWRRYWSALDEQTAAGVDLVLVDGRFRVACALNALLLLPQGTCVVVHDYLVRPKYQVVERFAQAVARLDSMAVLVRNPDADLEGMRALLERHALDWR